mmetsp:Transcript_56226/g.131369  ORF Transcript_56226/g.131369 Transcript_56226/m.131369 type:complete len:317 (-) Transcript_56226:64-1014(-)
MALEDLLELLLIHVFGLPDPLCVQHGHHLAIDFEGKVGRRGSLQSFEKSFSGCPHVLPPSHLLEHLQCWQVFGDGEADAEAPPGEDLAEDVARATLIAHGIRLSQFDVLWKEPGHGGGHGQHRGRRHEDVRPSDMRLYLGQAEARCAVRKHRGPLELLAEGPEQRLAVCRIPGHLTREERRGPRRRRRQPPWPVPADLQEEHPVNVHLLVPQGRQDGARVPHVAREHLVRDPLHAHANLRGHQALLIRAQPNHRQRVVLDSLPTGKLPNKLVGPDQQCRIATASLHHKARLLSEVFPGEEAGDQGQEVLHDGLAWL